MDNPVAKLLQPTDTSESGRPILLPTEVECQLMDTVSIEFEDQNGEVLEHATLRHGIIYLTTHRFIWMDDEISSRRKRSYGLPLPSVASIHPSKKSLTKLWSSPRLRLRVHVTREGILDSSGLSDGTLTASVVIVFRGQTSCDPFVLKFIQVHKEQAWKSDVEPKEVGGGKDLEGSKGAPSRFNPAMAGVSGILRKEKEQMEATDKNLHAAFSDLNALMAKAKDMVLLAERMRVKLLAPPSTSTAGDEEFGSKEEMQDWLLSVGIVSPVTKESAGAHYHQQLSRQLADFLQVPMEKAGGLLAVVDAYCLFNRARGTELISPEDMLQACALWDRIDVTLKLRRFDSGVAVIQRKTQNDEEIMAQIVQLVKRAGGPEVGVSPADVARALGVAPSLAKEELLSAEGRGLLCRDDSIDGLRFHINFFRDVAYEVA